MIKPVVADSSPFEIELEGNKKYAWCSCGLSKKQPFCDGAHTDTDLKPIVFKSEKNGKHWLCNCKQTENSPYCDGSHETLKS